MGTLLADRNPVTKENRYPRLEMLRLAIPRCTFTNNQMDVVGVALKNVFDRTNTITSGFKINSEVPIMRYFSVELERM